MMNIFKKCKIKKQIKNLSEKSQYAMKKMEEHLYDEDCTEWKQWSVLNALYLGEIIKLKSQM